MQGARGPHQDAGLRLNATEQHGLQLGPAVQLLPHSRHHAEAGLAKGLEALGTQFWHSGTQALGVLLGQHGGDLQQLGHLHEAGWGGQKPALREEAESGCGPPGLRAGPYPEHPCGHRNDLWEIHDAAAEFLLHVTQEQDGRARQDAAQPGCCHF